MFNVIFNFLIGFSNLFIGIYIFLITFGFYKKNEPNIFIKYQTLFQIISILLIIRGLYKIISTIEI